MHLNKFFLLILLFLASCKKETVDPLAPIETFSNGLLVLNEGLFQQNNSSLSWVDFTKETVNNTIFEDKVGRLLGDTGNDLKKYGGKIYIVVNVSSTIEVIDASTGKEIKQIAMVDGTTPKQPRSISFYQNKAYVTCYDGFVDVIDTATLIITDRIPVGANPEQSVATYNKLFVTNSGGLNYPNVDSTVSIIDLTSKQEIERLTIGKNPGGIALDINGNVYAISRGNYSTIPSRMHKIDPTTFQITNFSYDVSGITSFQDNFILTYSDATTGATTTSLFNPTSGQIITNDFLDLTLVTTLYGIQYSPQSQRLYVTDAMNYTNSGYVRVFDSNGNYITSHHVGLNPSKVIVYE